MRCDRYTPILQTSFPRVSFPATSSALKCTANECSDEDSDDDAQMRFDSILDSYGFTDYAPELTAAMAFVDLVPCDVGAERAGGLGGMGLSLEKTLSRKFR